MVLAGPTAVGKGTVAAHIREHNPEIHLSVSATTRPPRPGEIDGVHYYFVDDDEFDRLIADGELLEYAVVHNRSRYGTPRAPIDAALAADNTAKGAEFAAQARAALPDAASKQAAWASLIERDDAPNTIVRSAALGFVHPAGAEVLGEFVPKYFDMLLPVWESRTYQIAQYLIVGLFPTALADVALRDATRSWLSSHQDAPPALRRLVLENLADVERALAAQSRDAED
ncbi:MAG: hypothetical protein E2584_01865 [Microbacterium sp.]|nr:hypothetical protein [Microbacterium sp.]